MHAIVMSMGNELTSGQTVDTNSAWLSRQLAALGISVRRHITVADELDVIRAALDAAARDADVVLTTGGIGPTEDDLTRHALAAAMGVGLEFHAPSLEHIREFFARRSRDMPEANRIQAMFPAGSTPIENICGTAPGIQAKLHQADVFVMPGVPREMRVMFERSVAPLLAGRGAGVILMRTVHTFGAGESDVGTTIRDLMRRGRNPTVGTTAQQTIIGVRIQAAGRDFAEARRLLDADTAELRRRLGDLVFGEDDETLADAVGAQLLRTGQTVATAESCTGGLIAKSLTDVSGSSAYFLSGLVTYSNEAKVRLLAVPEALILEHGAVSAPVAEAMAVGGRRLFGADCALSTTGIAGPTGGTATKPVGLVFFGLAHAGGCEVHERRFGSELTRKEIRDRARKFALNLLRLRLLHASSA
ncbi:MAG: competence/damage-inducible protein A [Phycisphaerae bacterium]|nr:competence/damage-inducible protein A [Phycisphaerae bacterium]